MGYFNYNNGIFDATPTIPLFTLHNINRNTNVDFSKMVSATLNNGTFMALQWFIKVRFNGRFDVHHD